VSNRYPRKQARPRTGLSDPPSTVLNGPGSTTVSCLLMQDAVAADEVSLGSGSGAVALFANPFLDGKEEALIVNEKGHLTYLRRTASETGWLQSTLDFGAGPVTAAEVAVVVHPQDLTLWALYTAGPTGLPLAAELTSKTDGGVTTCAWEPRPGTVRLDASGPVYNGISRLFVSYDERRPWITGIDPATGNIVGVITTTADPKGVRFSLAVWWISASKTGPVAEFAAGHVPNLSVSYARVGDDLIRFDLPLDTPVSSMKAASDVAALVGVFRSTAIPDVGCLYLDKAGNLVTWSKAYGVPSGSAVTVTPGLDLRTAAAWTDVDGMVHVYGLDSKNTLKVLHQVARGHSGVPVWSTAVIRPVPLTPPHSVDTHADDTPAAAGPSTVTTCVGLVPDVARFVLDPFPDTLPTQLVKSQGVKDAGDKFSLHTQDIASARWSRDKVRLPSGGAPYTVSHYVSDVAVLDRRGAPMRALPVNVTAETLVEIMVEGASYLVGPGHSAQLSTSATGRIRIATHADSLLPATLHVDATGLKQGAVIQPAAAIHAYLGGNGTLPSQNGTFTADALKNAKADGEPIVAPEHHESVESVVASTRNLFEMADGQQPASKLLRGSGPAPLIHGFSVGYAPGHARHSPAVTVGYSEFGGPQEIAAHLDAIRALPQYGGIWDDFVNWAGDVWEGVKNGVIKVFEVAVSSVASVFVYIGDKIVELVGFVVDTVQSAVRAVEAVVREVVASIGKVVDWLKALFAFQDIWDSKTALRAGFDMMLSYGVATIEHYGTLSQTWFEDQRHTVETYFEDLKTTYAGRPLGDAANQIPAITDASANGLDRQELAANPQATWMLEKSLGSQGATAAAAAIDFPQDSPIVDAFAAFWAVFESSDVTEEVTAILGDLNTILAAFTDPADPDGTAKSSLPAVIDIVERLVLVVLKMLDHVAQAGLTLVKTIAENLGDTLDARIRIAPLEAFYAWIQTENHIETPEELTLGGLLFLIAGFAVTTGYKVVHGVDQAPFRGGFFPVIPAPPWHPAHDPSFSERTDPAAHNASMKNLQFLFGMVGALSAMFFDLPGDMAPLAVAEKWPLSLDTFIGGGAAVFSAGIYGFGSSCPPVTGTDWDAAKGAWTAGFAFSGIGVLLALGMLVPSSTVKPQTSILKNAGGVKRGPLLVTALSGITMTCIGQGCRVDKINPYTTASAVLGDLPGLLQFARYNLGPESQTRAYCTAGVNVVAAEFSAIMLLASAWFDGPYIESSTLKNGVAGQDYADTLHASGGDQVFNEPLRNWQVVGTRPPWLTLDPATGKISGVPTAPGKVEFSVQCTDSYNPPQYSPEAWVTIDVTG
jgi:Putative Ig domain